jgi:nucleoside-triphosphatase
MMTNIFILTGPIRSGKTSALLRWAADKKSIGGILTPDINGERVFQILPGDQTLPMLANSEEEEVIEVGRFRFSKNSFQQAIQTIYRSLEEKKKWIVIDEIGPLELRGEGFTDVLREMLRNKERDYKILLVVREGIVEKVIDYFGMNDSKLEIVENEDGMFRFI